ncbi:hypothetical protein SteCoe_2364 [Stentor coeruleus]|uniref:Uncharacterized protein n=1 Tax=Stentor coeruleus TaxID=5963 RepID=A0A1R2CZR0_9CILI|nr:hypothetical protein SteCoe_2364 [Stentor coeruleus]
MSKRIFSPLKKKGPWNAESFSIKLLEKEIELEKTFRVDIIQDLITMYSHAIEHYNEQNDPKYYDYQDRLHNLLLKPEVSTVLNSSKKTNLYNFSKHRSITNSQLAKSQIIESFRSPIKCKILESAEKAMKKEEILQNVSRQEHSLEDRVNIRRSRKNLSFCDESMKNSYYIDDKDQVVEVMESYYSKKAKEIEETTLKYLLQMESATPKHKARFVEDMKKDIIKISHKYDQLRVQGLQKFKDSYRKPN